MRGREIAWLVSSLLLIALVAFAVAGQANALFIAVVTSGVLATSFTALLFSNGRFFALTLLNLMSVYTAIFAFFIEELFGAIRPVVSGIGFAMPVVAFLTGCWRSRKDVSAVLTKPHLDESRSLLDAVFWLVPVFAVGGTALLLSLFSDGIVNTEKAFLAAMGAISAIVLVASRNIAVFLVDAGLLFEEFYGRMARLAIPAFAFLTSYALLVILFASLYTLVSLQGVTGNGLTGHFRVAGDTRAIGFSEAIHFSIVTLSTVGYGDIVPASNIARILASAEVICGVLLLLFGVSELQEYAREHRGDRVPARRRTAGRRTGPEP